MMHHKIKKLKVYGLPRSGTNFAEFMMHHNLNVGIHTTQDIWKHEMCDILTGICVIKNPYHWLVSIYNFAIKRKKIFHIKGDIDLSDFIRSNYVFDSDVAGPNSRKIFIKCPTPIDYWNNMYSKWLDSTILIIKYEDVLFNPEETLYSVGKHFKLRVRDKLLYPAEEIKPSQSLKIKTYNENKYYKINYIKNKEYIDAFKKQDLLYIENKLDLTLRERFNYDRV